MGLFAQIRLTKIVRKELDYKCNLTRKLFKQRLLEFGSVMSMGRKFSEIEAEMDSQIYIDYDLSRLPEFHIVKHIYTFSSLKNSGWKEQKIIDELLWDLNANQFDIGLPEVKLLHKPKDFVDLITTIIRKTSTPWDSPYFSDKMFQFLISNAKEEINKHLNIS